MKRPFRYLLSVLAVSIASLASAGAAEAELIMLGPELPIGGGVAQACVGNGCTVLNTRLPSGVLISPVDGLIVKWRMSHGGGTTLGGFRPEVIAPASGIYTVLLKGPFVLNGDEGVRTFTTELPIEEGQMFALEQNSSAYLGVGNTGGEAREFVPPLVEGVARGGGFQYLGSSREYDAFVLPEPTITRLTPATAPPAEGSAVVIEGSSFDAEYVEEVTFGGSPVSYTVDSDSRITAIAPPGSGEVPVTVTTEAGSATAPEQFAYREPPPPVEPTEPTTPVAPLTPTTSTPATVQHSAPALPGGWFGIKKIERDLSEGTARLAVAFTGSGEVTLTGKGVKPDTKTVSTGTVSLPIVPTGNAKTKLAQTGKADVTVTIAFRTAANVWTKTKSLALRLGE
jgi:IPT/TIG domain